MYYAILCLMTKHLKILQTITRSNINVEPFLRNVEIFIDVGVLKVLYFYNTCLYIKVMMGL